MSYVFFQAVLEQLGKKVHYESISNMYGRTTFDKKGGEAINKMITQADPFTKVSTTNSAATLLALPGALMTIEAGTKEQKLKSAEKTMGDTSWFEEFLT